MIWLMAYLIGVILALIAVGYFDFKKEVGENAALLAAFIWPFMILMAIICQIPDYFINFGIFLKSKRKVKK